MEKITAIIPTFNEEENIEKAIKSVLWADEIMIVDSYSTDRTLEIARKYTNFIIQREYNNSASQKNWAIPQASNQWIFLLDADEWASIGLEKEIKQVLGSNPGESAFWMKRGNHFMGKRLRFSGFQRDSVIRLFRKENCRYQDLHVHSEIETTGKVGRFKGRIMHNTYKSLDHFLRKNDRYTTWAAYDKVKRVEKVTYFHLLIKPLYRFVKHYFLQLGILDGKVGFILSWYYSYYVFIRSVKMMRIIAGEKLNENL